MNKGFLGQDHFVWFVGVVEDRHDPQKLGRVKVRCLGYHSHDKTKIKTADLPWAAVMQPVGGNALSGIGDSPIGIVEGSWVVGFFRDAESLQEPMIMGTMPGLNTNPAEKMTDLGLQRGQFETELKDYEFGFFDPTSVGSSTPYSTDGDTFRSSGGSAGKVTDISDDATAAVLGYDKIPTVKPLKTTDATLGTHSGGLVSTFGTTRRLTIEKGKDSGKSYGSGTDPTTLSTDPTYGSSPKVVSTGYLEDGTTRGDGAYWPLTQTEQSKTPYPRLQKILFGGLTTSQKSKVQELFDQGVYGNRRYSDLNATSQVILPRADTNRLAQGGLVIGGISPTGIVSISYGVKPNIAAGDTVQISGTIGTEAMNGQLHTLKAVSLGTTSGSLTISPPAGTWVRGGVVLTDPHTTLQNKSDTRERQINAGGTFLDDGSYSAKWNQPTSRYAAEYPYNHVYESESGHIKEFDDTPGAERIHEYHRSGTYNEVDQEGTKVDYVKGDRYNISVHDDYLYVKGHIIWTGDNEVLIASNDNMSLSSKWRLKVSSGGDIEIYSKRNISFRAEGDISMLAGGNINLEGEVRNTTAAGYAYAAGSRAKETLSTINIHAGTAHVKTDEGDISLFTKEGAIYEKAPKGNISMYSDTGEIHEKALNVYMNSTTAEPEEPEVKALSIPHNADSVTAGTTGQGAGLGINSTSGENIRKLRK